MRIRTSWVGLEETRTAHVRRVTMIPVILQVGGTYDARAVRKDMAQKRPTPPVSVPSKVEPEYDPAMDHYRQATRQTREPNPFLKK